MIGTLVALWVATKGVIIGFHENEFVPQILIPMVVAAILLNVGRRLRRNADEQVSADPTTRDHRQHIDGPHVLQLISLPPSAGIRPVFSPVGPALGAGALRDRMIVRQLETYGARVLADQSPYTAETSSLPSLASSIAAAQGTVEAGRFLDELTRVANESPELAIGVWLFVADHGLPPWRKSTLPTLFFQALRKLLDDAAAPPIAYRFNQFEAQIVRDHEPAESALWRLMPS